MCNVVWEMDSDPMEGAGQSWELLLRDRGDMNKVDVVALPVAEGFK